MKILNSDLIEKKIQNFQNPPPPPLQSLEWKFLFSKNMIFAQVFLQHPQISQGLQYFYFLDNFLGGREPKPPLLEKGKLQLPKNWTKFYMNCPKIYIYLKKNLLFKENKFQEAEPPPLPLPNKKIIIPKMGDTQYSYTQYSYKPLLLSIWSIGLQE